MGPGRGASERAEELVVGNPEVAQGRPYMPTGHGIMQPHRRCTPGGRVQEGHVRTVSRDPTDAEPAERVQEVLLADLSREPRHYALTVTIRLVRPCSVASDSRAFRCAAMPSFALRTASASVRPCS